ncbi:phosphoribosylamine--glycine ligase [Actinomycetota bacterium]|nr:phosphoribosylamine--glycine ligase [Actinomycetota bacterium]
MKIVVVGSGAREHALLRSLSKEGAHELFAVGSNPGIEELATTIDGVVETDGVAIAKFAKTNSVDLVIVGPEAPLAAGVVDAINELAADVAVFGPTKAATELEASKSFAKDIMTAAGVPTGGAVKCANMRELVAALNNADSSVPYVVKADGLAAGKGVIVTTKKSEAEAHASEVFHTGGFVILEEYLDGPEFSQFFICDGKTAIALEPAQDFKRIFDDDKGGNTGGMGSYSPLDWLPTTTTDWMTKNVAQPVVDEMARRGTPFVGVLFAGLAYTSRGVKVIEFNVRFGDPETQVILERLKSPLSKLLYAGATGKLSEVESLKWSPEYFVNVVLASAGYPESSHKGDQITGINAAKSKGAIILEAGTTFSGADVGQIVTNGGRVLSVVAGGKTLELARNRAYNFAKQIKFWGQQYRTDIAKKAVGGEIKVLTNPDGSAISGAIE